MTELLAAVTELLRRFAAELVEQQRHIDQLHADLDTANSNGQAANDVLRQLINIVAPELWQDNAANTTELITRVTELKARAGNLPS